MPYDDKPEFNDYLDERHDEIIIGDFRRPASIVLFEMDEIEYLNRYNLYLNQKKKNCWQVLQMFFPAPIAFYYERALHGYDNNHQDSIFALNLGSYNFLLYA
jgi:hypothetical protein